MRGRLVTLAGALLALLIFYGLFFNDQAPPPPTRPTTIEAGSNGTLALYEWLRDQGVAVMSLRERFDTLHEDDALPPSGNVLFVSLPYLRPPRENELAELKAWIGQGNTVLVSASLNDTLDWSTVNAGGFLNDLFEISGFFFTAIAENEDDGELVTLFDNPSGAEIYTVTPKRSHPLMVGIDRMAGVSDEISSAWRVSPTYVDLTFELATLDVTGSGMIWQRQDEAGQVIVVGSGSMFTNRAISRARNRQFIINVVRNHLAADGRFIFDDVHQGVSVLYDPEAFFADSRLSDTIGFVIGFWLLYIVGSSNRLLNPVPASGAPRQTDFVDAVAGFISRHAGKDNAGLWLYRSWFNDFRRRHHLPLNGEPVWDELARLRTLDPRLLDKLEEQYARLEAGRSIDPVNVHNVICRARRAIG